MEDILVPIFVCGILFIGMPWLIFHYVTKWKTAPKITQRGRRPARRDAPALAPAGRPPATVERIIAADNPDWRPGPACPTNAKPIAWKTARNCVTNAKCSAAKPATHISKGATEMADDSRTRFYLDKQNAKWKGVCAGIADYAGVDVTWSASARSL